MTNDRSLAWLIICLTAITAYRAIVLINYDYTLYIDEAYYWIWAQNLDWGYYSKPPAIAVLISGVTSVCGDSESCIRSIGILLYPLTAIGIYLSGRQIANGTVGLWAALLFFTMPAISVSSVVASTEIPLLLCWSWALYLFLRALDENSWQWWIMLGLVGGIGMLSKYNFAVFFFSGLLLMAVSKDYRHHLATIRPYVSVLIAFLLFLPNLLWNIENDFPTIRHTSEISGVLDQEITHWGELGSFLGSQFVVAGPIAFACLIAVFLNLKWWREKSRLALVMMCLPLLLIISGVALFGRANENWASPAYISGALLAGWWLYERGSTRLFMTAIAINLVVMFGLSHLDSIKALAGIELNRSSDPFKRLRGWDEFALQVEQRIDDPETIVVSQSRTYLSHYLYHSKQPIESVASWNPENAINHHFDLVTRLQPDTQQDYLLLGFKRDDCLRKSFDILQAQAPIVIPIYTGFDIKTPVYHARGFKGYMCE